MRQADGAPLRAATAFGVVAPDFTGIVPEPSDSPYARPEALAPEVHWAETTSAFQQMFLDALATRGRGALFECRVPSPEIPNIAPRVREFVLARLTAAGPTGGYVLYSRARMTVAITTPGTSAFDEIVLEGSELSNVREHAATRMRVVAAGFGVATAEYIDGRRLSA